MRRSAPGCSSRRRQHDDDDDDHLRLRRLGGVTEYDDQGTPIRRTYGFDGRPPFTPTPGLDFDRMGWTEDDVIVIGELAQVGRADA